MTDFDGTYRSPMRRGGCETSLHGLMEYTNWHTITLNKNAGFGRQSATRAA